MLFCWIGGQGYFMFPFGTVKHNGSIVEGIPRHSHDLTFKWKSSTKERSWSTCTITESVPFLPWVLNEADLVIKTAWATFTTFC